MKGEPGRGGGGVWYNDCDPFCCEWLRNLIAAGQIPGGTVDERPVQEVRSEDLRGFAQHHFFCGIAGWARALALAGWDPARPVWTASLPCQPFSSAGKRKGEADERHLWPVFFRLVRESRPPVCFGEQVDSADGRRWLARVHRDLEEIGYAVGRASVPACACGAPHRRQRLFWAAGGLDDPAGERVGVGGPPEPGGDGADDGVPREAGPGGAGGVGFWDDYDILPCRDGKVRRVEPGSFPLAPGIPRDVGPLLAGLGELGRDSKAARRAARDARCNRDGRVRGYGNAIVPQAAALFVRAFMEVEQW